MFSKEATKIDKIFTVGLTVTIYCQIVGEDFFNFVVFSENMNFIRVGVLKLGNWLESLKKHNSYMLELSFYLDSP